MTVTWWDSARDELADIYVTLSVTRQRVLAATVARIEEDRGWDGPGRQVRWWRVPPLGVWYVVSADGVEIAGFGA